MTDALDMDLVREFALNHSEAAFTELVQRHLNLVYSVARRCTGNDGDAQDVTQAVFAILARKAAGLRARTVLAGWLYETTRHSAACVQRTNARRHVREQEAYMQSTLTENANTATDWRRLAPHLEAAMSQLDEGDRTLLALRFYENKSGPEAAALLGIREAAAHKRTARALEKLRKSFTRRGVELSAAAIAGAVSANSVQAAPAGLAATITAAALSGTAITTSAFIAATKAVAMTTIQKITVTAALTVSAGFGFYEAKEAANARAEMRTLQQQQSPVAGQIQQLQHERDEAINRLAGMADELAQANRNHLDWLKLRGEIGMLRQQTNEVGKLRRANQKLLTQIAEQSISTNWLSAADQFTLRQTHAVDATTVLLNAIKSYAAKHNGQYPETLDQLTTSGDLGTTNFAGNFGLDDFELNPEGAVDPQGGKVILGIRVPIQRPGRESVLVWGCINSYGLIHTAIINSGPE
jgi:RNA polymerase sigma factor (sigma-70 family)